ncbi:MAG: glycerophosphodiester phosphodiesterase family protein [Myxococcales bacterium]|nr:glycerophosphodiester phosphodiesterase family protein [Myxococcales bacterium]
MVRVLVPCLLLAACTASTPDDADTDAVDSDTAVADSDTALPPLDVVACLDDPTCLRPLVAAHRGAGPTTPENSLAGLHAAADAGVPIVELDVRPTSDEVLVVMHDGDVDRTTDGTGDVGAMTAAEVAALHLDDGSAPPTFVAMLEAAVARGIVLYVDVKTDRLDLVVADIAAAQAHDHVLVRDGVDSLVRAAALDPTLRWLAAVEDADELDGAVAALPGLQWVELASATPDADFVAAAHARGLRVQQDAFLGDVTWLTTGTDAGWRRYLDTGVQLVQTDLAVELLDAIGQ